MSELGFTVKLNVSYEEAVQRATAALKTEGFGVLTTIDVKETLRQKLNVDFRRFVILGACNPPFAHRALNTDLDVGLLLPCNVTVREEGNGAIVSIVDPLKMLSVIPNPAMELIATEVRAKLERVAAQLRAGT